MGPNLSLINNATLNVVSTSKADRVDLQKVESFFSLYLAYTHETEVPVFFSRWAALSGIGTWLGRDLYFPHGHFNIYPNLYLMLIGQPATRKSTAIKLIRKLLTQAGYNTIAADRITKEKFLADLAGEEESAQRGLNGNDIDSINLFGENCCEEIVREMYIAADEFNDFFGNGNIEFASLLGSLWDYNGVYKSRTKTGKSVSIYNPTISILGGNTTTGFSLAFPSEILGQGFFSRLLLIYGEPRGNKIAFPKLPDPALTQELIDYLHRIKQTCQGELEITSGAASLLETIYISEKGVDDVRFDTYNNRRFTHLLKLCIGVCGAYCTRRLTESIVIFANTILTHTEHYMPRALGEFGKAKHADTMHKIMTVLHQLSAPISLPELWKHVVQDVDKMSDLADMLRNLAAADKIQTTAAGFLAKIKPVSEVSNSQVDYSLLTREEIEK